jgi:hypothetical protein
MDDARHAHRRSIGEHHLVERRELGFAAIIELLANARADLRRNLARIDRRPHAAMERKENVEIGEIGLDRRGHVRILQLAGKPLAIERNSAMDLAERRGGGRMRIEFGEATPPIRPELGLHAAPDKGGAHRRRLGLQAHQFLGVIGRQRLGNGRQHLGDFHQRPFERAERAGQRLRLAARILAAEQAVRRHAGGERADIGADAGVTRRARRETIGFAVRQSQPIASSSPIMRSIRESPMRQKAGSRASSPNGLSSSE